MTAYVKPDNITGLNTSHTNYGNVVAFYEIGQTDKELVGDTSITTTATYVDDTDIGECRLFDADADELGETTSLTDPCTILIVINPQGKSADGTSSAINYTLYEGGGNEIRLSHDGYGGGRTRIVFRGGYGSYRQKDGTAYTSDAEYNQGQCIAATFDDSDTMYIYRDGSSMGSDTGSSNTAGTNDQTFMNKVGTAGDVYVGAIVVFDTNLSTSDLATVTADPWDLVTAGAASIIPQIMHHRGQMQ